MGWLDRLGCLGGAKENLLFNPVVKVEERAIVGLLSMHFEITLQLLKSEVYVIRELCRGSIWSLKHQREESLAHRGGYLSFFASVKATLEDEHVRDGEEDFSIAALNLFLKLRILLTCTLDKLTETY